MYAIVEISGKQYKVRENDRLFVPLQQDAPDSKISFDRVLLVSGENTVSVGTPLVAGASVEATVLAHVKADKVLVFKKKRRKRYRVKRGHRQPYTRILVDALSLDAKPKAKKAAAPKAEAKAPKAETKAAAPKAEAKAPKAEAKAPKAETKAAAPKAEAKAPKAAAPKAKKPRAKKAAKTGDDLTRIEGIGPKISGIFVEAGIDSFAKLAAAEVATLRDLLAAAGPRYRTAVPDTWPEQAALAGAGDWDGLQKLHDELDGGRRA
jgi:large subunit ribosomal protein L21